MTKVVSLSDQAYEQLKHTKGADESFSNAVVRLIGSKQKPLLDFFGRWPGGPQEIERIGRELARKRKEIHTRKARL